jgi:glycosyltransferase involved in cell wall biosynthesis
MSNALMEAMAAKLPIITTNIDVNRELIKNAGILVPPKNSEAIAKEIIQLIKNSALRKELGEKAYEEIVENYSIPVVIKKNKDLLISIFDKKL